MPGGRRYIPERVDDAEGRSVVLWNPHAWFGCWPKNAGISTEDWNQLRPRLDSVVRRDSLIGLTVIAGVMGWSLVYAWFLPRWLGAMLACFVLIPLFRKHHLFINVSEGDVCRAMLRAGRCPGCAYPLPAASPEAVVRCPECGAAWRQPRG